MECRIHNGGIYCPLRILITDRSKLCEDCPIPGAIDKQLEIKIIKPIHIQKQLLEPDVFKQLINAEILNAVKCMNEMVAESNSSIADTKYAGNWTFIYLWNEARIMALNKVLYGHKTPEKTKADILHSHLAEYGFYELEKVKILTDDKQRELIQLLATHKLPYVIAMFDFLGYLNNLSENYFDTKNELCVKISKWFGADIDGRNVKGNINSLVSHSEENKSRYTAYKHAEEVQNDYQNIK